MVTSPSGRLLGFIVLATMLAGLAACSPGSEKVAQRSEKDARQAPAHRETLTAPEGTTATGGETTARTDSRAAWDYVALGDSLAAGVGARRGYVDRYAEHLRNDTGARVRVVNLGHSSQTSSQLLYALRNDPSTRRAIGGAEVITFNIGINDLGHASRSYENGTCGGAENERCLGTAVGVVEGNWEAIIEEILGLRSTDEAIIRTAGLGYTPQVDGVFETYLAEVNRHMAAAAVDNGIPCVEVQLDDEGMSPDGVHPDDHGGDETARREKWAAPTLEPLQP